MTLPDCMMPDGADPCRGYHELRAENERLEAELTETKETCSELRLFDVAKIEQLAEAARKLRAENEQLKVQLIKFMGTAHHATRLKL
jgi:hypothetical protein